MLQYCDFVFDKFVANGFYATNVFYEWCLGRGEILANQAPSDVMTSLDGSTTSGTSVTI